VTGRVGPYLLSNVIGRGGTGIVYRARHAATGEVVALKQVVAESVRDLGSMRREIDALRRLEHPGVVRIVAQGVDAGVPWYAMELLEGETLQTYLRRLWTGHANRTMDGHSTVSESCVAPASRSRVTLPPPAASDGDHAEPPTAARGGLSFVLELILRLCDTLAFMHGEGVVHRDLKSSNVLVCSDGALKLLDFGLAWRFPGSAGREVLDDVSGGIAGTAGYMSPEQIRGELVDARADLYSLGCVLYESLTGRLPFNGSNAAEVLRCHLNAPVIPPSRLVAGVPPALDQLVLRLLEKRAEDRPGHASEVARALSAISGADRAWGNTRALPRSYVYRSAIVGRAEPLGALAEHVGRALAGQGSLILVSGESGVGKTYLAMAAARQAAMRGLRVITSTCVPLGVGGAQPNEATLQPFRRVLISIADRCVASPELLPALLGTRAKVLAECEPQLLSLPTVAAHPEPESLPPRAAQERLLLALEQTIGAFVEECPCVCIIDDLQWADDVSLRFFASLPDRWFSERRLVMIGVYRAEEEPEVIRGLLRRSDTYALPLGRLTEQSVGDLVRGMLAIGSPPAGFVDSVVRQSEGNPFFATEYLRTAVGEQLLHRGPGGDWEVDERLLEPHPGGAALALPSSVAELIARRLGGLSEAAQRLLAAAAVLGREMDLALLLSVAELSEEEAWEPARELVARQILEDVSAPSSDVGRHLLRFLHDKLRDTAYVRITEAERRALHRRAANAMERTLHGSPELCLVHATLAHHHEQGGQLARAVDHLEQAGDHSLAAYANADAIRHFDRALELAQRLRIGSQDATRRSTRGDRKSGDGRAALEANLRGARWERKLAEAHYALGDLEAVERHIVRSLEYAGYPPPRSTLGWTASLLVELGRQILHRSGTVTRGHSRDELDQQMLVEAAMATHHFAEQRYYGFEPLPMIVASLRAVNLGESARVAVPIATPYAMLGMTAGISKLPGLGQRYFELARSAALRTSDDAGMAYSLYSKAAWRIGSGAWSEVYALCNECEEIARRTRNVKALGMAQTLIGHAAFYTGQFRESARIYRELEETARSTGDVQHLSWGLYAGARARMCLGQLAESRAMLLESNALLEPLVEVPSKIIAPGLLASVHLRSGDLEAALSAADLTTTRIRKNLPTVFATVAGYAGAAEVYLARWAELARNGRGDRSATLAARKVARRAVLDLLTLALSIPIGWPYYYRLAGEARRLDGKSRAAKANFRRCLRSARELGMPYDEALAHLELARLEPPRSAPRDQHLSDAERMLEKLGCPFDLERARRLRSETSR
jgi:eukaryotic-like serine/threonine-protein kinase